MAQDLNKYAATIPELGGGGRTIGKHLTEAAAKVSGNIIDIGPWFGSTTAYLALGVLEGGNVATIHSFDVWMMTKMWRDKARIFNKLDFSLGESSLPMFLENVKPFGVKVVPHQVSILDAEWDGGEIELYVDDCCNGKARFDAAIKTFSPHFIPGKTEMFLMDHFFPTDRISRHRRYALDFMAANDDVFKFARRLPGSITGVFRYMGGEPNYVQGESYDESRTA